MAQQPNDKNNTKRDCQHTVFSVRNVSSAKHDYLFGPFNLKLFSIKYPRILISLTRIIAE